jgi:class 3 adenylate cyclase/TolB-like protein
VEQNRQLAAIMFTDIVGYTALMGKDEQQAITLLHDNRVIHENSITNHNGKLLKEMGDGILAQFNSALDAVQCAIEIQAQALGRVEGKLRIGIHLGDVIVENNDVFGDGVNIASRLQSIADSGGIYISESVQKAIRSRNDIAVQYLCEVKLKNVDYPVKTYALIGDGLPVVSSNKIEELSYKASRRSKLFQLPYMIGMASVSIILVIAGYWWLSSMKPNEIRIAVLPVENMTMVENGDFIVKGMHSAIIDEVNKISAIMVTSKTSSSKYKGADKTIPEIANELNVEMLVESELTQFGDSVQLRFRLIQAFPEEQVWSISYSKSTKDILSVYGDVAMEISRVTNINLTAEEISAFTNTRKVNPEAYKAYLTGKAHLFKLTSQGIDKALQYFNLSIEKDSMFAPAYLGIAFVWGARRQQGLISLGEAMGNIERATQMANNIDSKSTELETDAEIHFLMALTNCWTYWQWEDAEEEFIVTINLDPNHADARAYYSLFLSTMLRPEEAKEQIERAMELEPFSSIVRSLYAMYLRNSNQPDEAIKILKKTLEEDPEYDTALGVLWTLYNNKKMYNEAVDIAKRVYTARGENRMVEILTNDYVDGNYRHVMEKLAEAYITKKDTSYVTPWQITTLYTRASNSDKALEWLEKAYEEHDNNMYSISADPIFNEIRDQPRFQKILKEMGLPQ